MAQNDLFDIWRLILGLICTVYAIVVTLRSLWGWIAYLSGPDRTASLVRNYVAVQVLRLRVRSFSGELLGIVFWAGALITVLYAHRWVAAQQ